MKKIVKAAAIACFALSAVILSALFVKSAMLPDSFMVESGEQLQIDESVEPKQLAGLKNTGASYDVQLKMFGIFPIKNVNVSEVPAKCVVPCGTPFGIKMFTNGVMVVGLTEVDTVNGLVNPAKQAGIKIGDTILEMNGIKVRGNSDIVKIIQQSKGGEISVVVKRKQSEFTVSLRPVISKTDGCYKAGLWVRDSSAGIGTVTFYDKSTGVFGGLGHPVCDIDTGEIMPLMSGEVVNVTITDVNKGLPGLPGELRGLFKAEQTTGCLIANTETGVYGMLNACPTAAQEIPVALKQQVTEGSAYILSTIEGEQPRPYAITIEKVNLNNSNPTKNMIIRITDKQLLNKTGGIVQGMSGSPIIQNGRLVGAVTHVFVNDPTRGYGIFGENMINSAQKINTNAQEKAS